MKFKILFTMAWLWAGASLHAADAQLQVLATIKPLQLIALAVTGGDASVTIETLLPAQASPHHYQLRPSDRQKIAEANLVLWVGPGLELFLERVLTTDKNAQAMQPEGNHQHDAHVWMDPLAAAAYAERIAITLGKLRPARALQWRDNAASLRQRLQVLDADLRQRFMHSANQGYLVSHDAFAPFESRYGLRHTAALSDGEERPPGPRRIARIKTMIASGAITCVMLEPHYDRKFIETVVGTAGIRQITADSMAQTVPADAEGLEVFYRGLGRSFAECLALTVSGR